MQNREVKGVEADNLYVKVATVIRKFAAQIETGVPIVFTVSAISNEQKVLPQKL